MKLRLYIKQLLCKHDDEAIADRRDNQFVLFRCKKCKRLLAFSKFMNFEYKVSELKYDVERDRWIDIQPQIPKENGKTVRFMRYEPLPQGIDTSVTTSSEERENPQPLCNYCGGKRVELGHSHSTTLFMDTIGKKQTLETECDPCPDYSQCGMKHVPARTAFLIHYCPMCGRKLDVTDDRQEPQPLQRAFALACRILGDEVFCPNALFYTEWLECEGETEQCGDRDVWKCWQKYINETVQAKRVCRVCGCTELNACIDKDCRNNCYWVEDDLCSACVTEPKGELNG